MTNKIRIVPLSPAVPDGLCQDGRPRRCVASYCMEPRRIVFKWSEIGRHKLCQWFRISLRALIIICNSPPSAGMELFQINWVSTTMAGHSSAYFYFVIGTKYLAFFKYHLIVVYALHWLLSISHMLQIIPLHRLFIASDHNISLQKSQFYMNHYNSITCHNCVHSP